MKKVALLFLLIPVVSAADSFYSAQALGMVSNFSTSRSSGMGGASMAVRERMSLSALNPASIHIDGLTTISADYQYESVDAKSAASTVNTRDGRPSGFKFVLPIKYQLNLITSLTPILSSKYTLAIDGNLSDTAYQRKVIGYGGLSSGNLGLVYHFNKDLSLAGLVNLYFGTYNEDWKTDFTSSYYVDGTDEMTSHFRGIGGELSVYYQPLTNFSLGALYRHGADLHVETKTTLDDYYDTPVVSLTTEYPGAQGAGFAWRIKKVVVAADYFQQQWQNYRVRGMEGEKMNRYWRFGGGLEYNDTQAIYASYPRRMFFRLGAYHAQLPIKTATGETIDESFVSFGVGLPFHANRGRIDMAFELGRRGDLQAGLYEETIARLSFSIGANELWFHRPTR
ncbi:MAG TPA: hypothetical protein PKN04_06280 [bacterium]|nr:hypothetical protein [bacterium]HNT65367.1 hypothetical protein [bacterium]HOX86535.1 hypothetical protein [bacterium]HPG46561.1 hypothetical protein [bacterium]HPM98383.1 hypothetical protein [bacterium]